MKATCDRITVVKPSRRPTAANSSSSDAASTISGATVGIVSSPSSRPWRRKRWRWKASAAAVATLVATSVAAVATSRLLRSDARMAGLVAAFQYQSSVAPSHEPDRRPALNESATSTRIGA